MVEHFFGFHCSPPSLTWLTLALCLSYSPKRRKSLSHLYIKGLQLWCLSWEHVPFRCSYFPCDGVHTQSKQSWTQGVSLWYAFVKLYHLRLLTSAPCCCHHSCFPNLPQIMHDSNHLFWESVYLHHLDQPFVVHWIACLLYIYPDHAEITSSPVTILSYHSINK